MTSLFRTLLAGAALAASTLMTGCAMQAPRYQPSLDNVEQLKKSGAKPVNVGAMTAQPGATGATSISLRGNPMSSSVGGDYAAYLADAIKQELALAGLLDPKAAVEVTAVLLKNDIAAAGIVTNSGEVEARFIVRSGGQVRYESVKRADLTWDSSFIGGVAIPKAQQQYPVLVQQLLARLLADPQFIAAIR